MDRPIFNPLVALEMKPEVTSVQVVNIRFPGVKKMDIEGSLQIVGRPGVKIVNKRKGPEYRDQILQRLHKNADLPFSKRIQNIPDVITEEETVTVQPVKKGRMIIRQGTYGLASLIPATPPLQAESLEIISISKEVPREIVNDDTEIAEVFKAIENIVDIDEKEGVAGSEGRRPSTWGTEGALRETIGVPAKMVEKQEKGNFNEKEGVAGSEGRRPSTWGTEGALRETIGFPANIDELAEELATGKKKRGRKPKMVIVPKAEAPVDLTVAVLRTQKVADRLPKERERITMPVSNFYMNNRKIFVQKLADIFKTYRQEILSDKAEVSCDTLATSTSFDLLTHQKIARDYLNLYTPYRGLLLYLSLGSGKSCTSIAVAEGMKSSKRIVVMTPASLKMNFFNELKKCGDVMYKRNQFWEFVSIDGHPEYVAILSAALNLSTDYVKKNGGAWLVNVNKESNYSELKPEEQSKLDTQLDEMIRSKYTDINYNGLRMDKLKSMTDDLTRNPFDNSVVIIDEAHNFVSRIVNKIKKPNTIPYQLYQFLLSAKNARVVLLTGSPIINYPNEIGILYNILRGHIKTWTIPITVKTSDKITTDSILDMFDKENFKTYDYVEYAGNVLTITRNPFGFINTKKRGVVKGTIRVKKVGGKTTKKDWFSFNKEETEETDDEGFSEPLGIENPRSSIDVTKLRLVKSTDDELHRQIMKQSENVPDWMNDEEQQFQSGGAGDVFNKYGGVQLNDAGNISDEEFQNRVLTILRKNGLDVQVGAVKVENFKALPDDPESFFNMFINADTGELENIALFQRRILGLTSYYRSAQETLLPSFVTTKEGDDYHVEKCPMSNHQFSTYVKIRKEEADKERNSKKRARLAKGGDDLYTISSTYRIFSRAACNFAFPDAVERPLPNVRETEEGEELDESGFDAIPANQRQVADAYTSIDDEEAAKEGAGESAKYENRIQKALEDIAAKKPGTDVSEYLSKESLPEYSPKFSKVLENLQNPENEGLHLIYSHFRTIEGIGLLKLILEANGFGEFKIKKSGDMWEWIEDEADIGKPTFTLYTGTEDEDEKEIKRNIYNGVWDLVPSNIATKLRERAENNNLGEIIKIFMITSSGAEGINLRNTRFVHIVEPYWHMVRVDQVVGRARRICSHQDLSEDMRNVEVFLYVTTFTEEQKTDEKNIELRLRDISRIDKKTPVTTDETLYEIASVKQKTNNQILKAMKETAIDCQLYASTSKRAKGDENLVCYGFGKVESNQFSSYPNFETDRGAKEGLDVQRVKWTARKITQDGTEYALNEDTMEVYDYESYQKAKEFGTDLVLVGKLVKKSGKYIINKET